MQKKNILYSYSSFVAIPRGRKILTVNLDWFQKLNWTPVRIEEILTLLSWNYWEQTSSRVDQPC